MLALLTLLGAFALSAPSFAQLVTTTFGPFTVNCTPSGQLCDNTFSQSIGTASTLRVQYNASAGHCSNVAVHILVDGVEKAVTAFLTPGQSSGFFDVRPRESRVSHRCVEGRRHRQRVQHRQPPNWGGTLDVVHEATIATAAAAAVPTLSPPLLAALVTALFIAAGWSIRRKS
jgi:hypothetical protein